MRRRAHTRLKALFTIAASREVVERDKSHVHSVVIDLGRGTVHQANSLLFCSAMFFSFFFWVNNPIVLPNVFFSDFFASIVLQIFHGRKSLFTLFFSFPCFYDHVSCLFFSLLMFFFFSNGSDCRGQNTSSRDMNESSGGNGHQDLKKEVSCWRVFEHDWRSELMDQNLPRRIRRLIIFGKIWQQ